MGMTQAWCEKVRVELGVVCWIEVECLASWVHVYEFQSACV